MRLSKSLIPTLKETPAEAQIVSHRLMLRAGMIRQMGTGLWTWLPAGLRVHRKVETILREEMDRAGAQEMVMPVMQPSAPWEKTGRYGIDEFVNKKLITASNIFRFTMSSDVQAIKYLTGSEDGV